MPLIVAVVAVLVAIGLTYRFALVTGFRRGWRAAGQRNREQQRADCLRAKATGIRQAAAWLHVNNHATAAQALTSIPIEP